MDENEALTGQGANAQGEHPNNQTMESLLESESMSVELPQVGEIRKGMIASIGANQILVSGLSNNTKPKANKPSTANTYSASLGLTLPAAIGRCWVRCTWGSKSRSA